MPIDPTDVGRTYDADVIRVNSQSGKGGIGYILEESHGFHLPPKMREDFGYVVKDISDKNHKELKPEEIYQAFNETYCNKMMPLHIVEAHYIQQKGNNITAMLSIEKMDRCMNVVPREMVVWMPSAMPSNWKWVTAMP